MGLFDGLQFGGGGILGNLQYAYPGFGDFYDRNDQQAAQDAREAAAARLSMGGRRPQPPMPNPSGPDFTGNPLFMPGLGSMANIAASPQFQSQQQSGGGMLPPWLMSQTTQAPIGAGPSPQPPMQPQNSIPPQAQQTSGPMITPGLERAPPPPLPQAAQSPFAPAQEPGLGDRLLAGFGGFAHGGTLLGGISNLIEGISTGQRSDPRGMQQAQIMATYNALIGSGVPEPQARAAALNPEILKTIAPEHFGGYKVVQTGETPIGKNYMLQGPGGKLFQIGGDSGPGSIVGGSGSGGIGTPSFLAPGVKYDPTLSGEDYLKQFGPEVQAAVRSYINGDVMPTGNPRQQGISTFAKTVAQKYGQDMGIPVSDATYAEKRRYRSELGSNSPTTAGGQAKAFVQGIEHAVDLADTFKKLDNSNGLGIPIIAQGVNTLRQSFSIDQQALADKAQGIGQTLAGEVGKLFSGSAGGGVHEREMTRARFDTVRSKPQLAAALEATLETMEGGLTALENRRDQVLGPNSSVELVPKQTREKINQLRQVIAELKGQSQGAAPQPAAPQVTEGATATNPQTGQKIMFKNGQWMPVQ